MTNPGEGREFDLKIVFQIANLNSGLPYYIILNVKFSYKNWEKKINMNIGSIHRGKKQSIETPWGSPDVGLKGQRLKSAIVCMFKELKD